MREVLLWLRQHMFTVLIVLAITAGLALRLFQFGSIPVSLYWDEMAIWNDAQSVASTGRDMFNRSAWQPLFISYGDFKLPMYIWLTSLVVNFTNNSLIGARLVSLIAGLNMLPATYFLARRLGWGQRQSLVATALLAILPWSIHFSRVGFEAHLASALLLWSLVFLFSLTQLKITPWTRALFATLAWISSVAAFYTYFSFRYVWPIILLAAITLWWQKFRPHWRLLVFVVIGWFIALIPMFQADYYRASEQLRLSTVNIVNQPDRPNQVNLWRERAGNHVWTHVLYNQKTFLALDLAKNLTPFFSPQYLFADGEDNLRHGNGFTGLTWWVTLPLLLLGIIYLWQRDRRLLTFLIIWWLASILPAAVPLTVPHSLRSINALPIMPLLSAAGLIYLWQWKISKLKVLAMIFGGALLIIEVAAYSFHYFGVYPQISANNWQDGYHQLAEYLSSQSKDQPISVNIGDDRFFLYYLSVSGMTWEDIQQLPSSGFKRQQVANIEFENDELTSSENTWLVIPAGEETARRSKRQVIMGKTGQPVFEVYE